MKTKKNEVVRILRVNFTDAERLELGKQLAEVHNNTAQVNSDFDRVKAEFKSKLTALEAQSVDLAAKVSTGYSMKDVKCVWEMDQPKAGKKTLSRLDTPKPEVIETTDMTEADKQGELGLSAEDLKAGVEGGGTVTVASDRP